MEFLQRTWFTMSTVTDVVSVYAGPLDAVPVIVQVPADAGAVNKPSAEIEPQEDDHETDWLALKDCVFRACRLTLAGVIMMGEVTVASVLAVFPLPSVAVAVIVQEPSLSGAVNRPDPVTDPHDADQVAGAPEENC